MKKILILIVAGIVCLLVLGFLGVYGYQTYLGNPKVIEELRAQPASQRAEKVLLMTLPDGREIPVNYLKENNKIYLGADGRWWRLLQGEGAPVTLLVQGTVLHGHAKAILGDTVHRDDIFSRLRPNVPAWLPDVLNGVLVEVTID